jgi:hypothetical protein
MNQLILTLTAAFSLIMRVLGAHSAGIHMKKLLILAIAILGIVHPGFAFEAGSTESATSINAVPYTISSPGIYYLASDILNGTGKITINASNVVLDLGGHTLQVSTPDECVLVQGNSDPGIPSVQNTNVTVQNGVLVNKVASCLNLAFTSNCTLEHLVCISAGQTTLLDGNSTNNRISHCSFTSGKPALPQGPNWKYGPGYCTIMLVGASDLLEDNIITSPITMVIYSFNTGGESSFAGNTLVHNVIHAGSIASPIGPVGPGVVLDQYDVYSALFFPGQPAGHVNVSGGVHATE